MPEVSCSSFLSSNEGASNCRNNSPNNPISSGSCIPGIGCSISNNGNVGNSNIGLVGGGTSAAAAKNQLEQLNTMREALFSQDGWGCQHVNQDTNWEVPSSPEPTNKDPNSGPSMWKPTINNGTDLWELNLRNGGQPPTQPVQKTSWGHTPSSNLGGTWGEDDDGAESSSVWTSSSNIPPTGVLGGSGVNSGVGGSGPGNGPQWGQTAVGVGLGTTGNTAGGPIGIGSVASVGGAAGGPGVSVPGCANSTPASSSVGNNWSDTRDVNNGAVSGALAMRGVDPRDSLRGTPASETRDLRILDPREHNIRGDLRGISGRLNGSSEMWGQHHSISHNQMPTMNKMVGATVSMAGSAVVAPGGGIGPVGVATINTPGISGNVNTHWGPSSALISSKDIAPMAAKASGWEEPSPPSQRRNIPNYDDGTSLWGQQPRAPSGGGSHWKDIPDPMNRHLARNSTGNPSTTNSVVAHGSGSGNSLGNQSVLSSSMGGTNTNNIGSVGPQGRLGSGVGPNIGITQHKSEALWVHGNNQNVGTRNSAPWGDDGSHSVGLNSGVSWMDDKTNSNIGQLGVGVCSANSWNDIPVSWNKSQNRMPGSGGGWSGNGASDGTDLSSDWSNHGGILGKAQKVAVNVNMSSMNTDVVRQSKQYRVLVESGFKKEDVERALVNSNMNIEEAAELLRASAISMDWRRHEETLGSYGDHTNTSGSFPGRYPPTGNHANLPFPPNILNNMSGTAVNSSGNNANISALNSIQPLPGQKYLNPTLQNVTSGHQNINPAVAFGQGVANVTAAVTAASNSNSQPSAQQLRVLVQQIQLAVQSGYLSSQILSEPLPSSMLVLLYQLLTNIKHLQAAQQSLSRGGNNSSNSQIGYAISKYKQQIQNLQNQINAQQAFILKQKQHTMPQATQHPAAPANLDYIRGQQDTISALQNNLSQMNLSKPGSFPSGQNSQSKLINQWKLPEKELTSDNTDFSRAPGTTKQNLSNAPSNAMGSLGLQTDATWSTGRSINDGWPDTSTETENKDWSVVQHTPAATYTDLVPEFEPGKPWKGSQLKSIEDDPNITPGSLARSPLSINSVAKESDLFTNPGKSSPTDLTSLSLSSSTWSFNPTSSNPNFQSSQQCASTELWASSINKSSRGPPPGMGGNKGSGVTGTGDSSLAMSSSVMGGSCNAWMVTGGHGVQTNNSGWNSTWLLLKNLTAQIDASTLRTLCMQHGPLVNFHLYLNQGIALCKYATREEANKAQMTLNNCVLGTTTICAESPSENEVQGILQHFPQPNNASVHGGNGVTNSKNNSGTAGSGNSSNNGNNSGITGNSGNGNGGVANHSVVVGSGANNNCGPNASNNITGGNSDPSNSSTNIGNNTSAAASTWRPNQNQLNQSRPSGRDEYDYISKFVCSIVDD